MDLDKISNDLEGFRTEEATRAVQLSNIVEQHARLIEAYRLLKSDYEEARESREKYKTLVKGYGRESFVLVLVDGDGYILNDRYLLAREKGGVEAAQDLYELLRQHLSTLGGDTAQCRIMVRVYSNFKGLSNTLAKLGLCGNEARSIATVACGFTRAQELFDFVDAGEVKEGADRKIEAMFKMNIENPQCKHIFLAGCHDKSYVNTLTSYAKSAAQRITLIKGSYFDPKFNELGLPTIALPTIFRDEALPRMNTKPKESMSPTKKQFQVGHLPIKDRAKDKAPCPFFAKGNCRYADTCHNSHETRPRSASSSASSTSTDSDNSSSTDDASSRSPEHRSTILIPVDSDGDRVDIEINVTEADTAAFYKKAAKKKLCNEYHLGGGCINASCIYDHSKVNAKIIQVLRKVARKSLKCPKGGDCRSANCYRRHSREVPEVEKDSSDLEWVQSQD